MFTAASRATRREGARIKRPRRAIGHYRQCAGRQGRNEAGIVPK